MFRCASPFARSFRPAFRSLSAKRSIGDAPVTGKATALSPLPFPTLFARSVLPFTWSALRSQSSRSELRAEDGANFLFKSPISFAPRRGQAPLMSLTRDEPMIDPVLHENWIDAPFPSPRQQILPMTSTRRSTRWPRRSVERRRRAQEHGEPSHAHRRPSPGPRKSFRNSRPRNSWPSLKGIEPTIGVADRPDAEHRRIRGGRPNGAGEPLSPGHDGPPHVRPQTGLRRRRLELAGA